MFKEYLATLSTADSSALEKLIAQISELCPEASEGLSYGLPAFRYKSRPLIGFSSTQGYLSLYTFEPRIIDEVRPELAGYDIGKGVIRFTPQKPLPEQVVGLLVELRMNLIDKK